MTHIKSTPAAAGLNCLRRLPRVLGTALVACAVNMGGLATGSAQATAAPQSLPTTSLTAGMHLIKAMVADSPEERSTGLMFRTEMAANEGMLFVFDDPAQQCFWMKNTLLPLSAAFVADDGTVVNIEDMKPQSLDSHCSKAPVRYVLEMNKGWFAKKGIRAGSKLAGGPFR
jgi:uncharacterized membrane protein (UPF0127 family)